MISDFDINERLDVIDVCGVRGLFTNGRVPAIALPVGVYKYDIRHGDDGNFCTIEKRVIVNHAGTILLKEPLNFDGKDYIDIQGDAGPNFLGEHVSTADFFSRADT